MKKIFGIIILSSLIFGCAQIWKTEKTTFEPIVAVNGVSQFRYMAHSTVFSPADDSSSEKERMEWLEMWLKDNDMCSKGYIILERKPVATGYYDSVKNIYYYGQCK